VSSSELAIYDTDHGRVELSAQVIRDYLVPPDSQITDQEIKLFIELARFQKLNPYLREVYLVKYGNQKASIITGKDVFTKRAFRNPRFDGMESGITVATPVEGAAATIERREGALAMSGETIVGGWARVHMKDQKVPVYVEIAMREYIGKKSDGSTTHMWATKPATMIRKVAIVQALREAFPEDLQGLYSEEEMGVDAPAPEVVASHTEDPDVVDAEIVDPDTPPHASVPADDPSEDPE
jgi:phage recombination protein Bet